MSDYGDHESTDDPLEKLRHSTAHLLAAAVTELYPEAKYGIGPAVQDGFYYDFDFGKPISESDLPAIESRKYAFDLSPQSAPCSNNRESDATPLIQPAPG